MQKKKNQNEKRKIQIPHGLILILLAVGITLYNNFDDSVSETEKEEKNEKEDFVPSVEIIPEKTVPAPEEVIKDKRKRNKKSIILLLAGVILILLAGGIAIRNIREEKNAEDSTDEILEQITKSEAVPQDVFLNEKYLLKNMVTSKPKTEEVVYDTDVIIDEEEIEEAEQEDQLALLFQGIEIGDNLYATGILHIPTLSLTLPVLSECTDELLKKSICIYERTEKEDSVQTVIAGHTYKSHFKYVPTLLAGEVVYYFDIAEQIVYSYAVTESQEIASTDFDTLRSGEWDLTLLTCNYNGSKRVIVRCVSVD